LPAFGISGLLLRRPWRYFPPDGVSQAAVLAGVAFVPADAEPLGEHALVVGIAGAVDALGAVLVIVALVSAKACHGYALGAEVRAGADIVDSIKADVVEIVGCSVGAGLGPDSGFHAEGLAGCRVADCRTARDINAFSPGAALRAGAGYVAVAVFCARGAAGASKNGDALVILVADIAHRQAVVVALALVFGRAGSGSASLALAFGVDCTGAGSAPICPASLDSDALVAGVAFQMGACGSALAVGIGPCPLHGYAVGIGARGACKMAHGIDAFGTAYAAGAGLAV